jgi:membrane glycosyltransferase
MKKDPFTKINLGSVVRNLWLGTILGIYGFYFCTVKTPYFVWQTAPILASLSLSILTVYLTSKTIPEGWKKWI